MTSPVDGNESFGYLQVQYTYRFIGKSRGDEGFSAFDMTDRESVRAHHLAVRDSSVGTEIENQDEPDC